MRFSHTNPVTAASFDDPNLITAAGVVPVMRLAAACGLAELADEWLTVPTDKGSNPGAKVSALVTGMIMGADSISDMGVLRHGAMGTLFDRTYAPSTLGSFLRTFTYGHTRQLDAVATRFLGELTRQTSLLGDLTGPVMLDIDDTVIEVHGYDKQGAQVGYTGTRGLNVLLTTLTTPGRAPVICGQRLRRGARGSSAGAASMITSALATLHRVTPTATKPSVLVRADSAFYSCELVHACLARGAHVSITLRRQPDVLRAITEIADTAWTAITYTHPVYDPDTNTVVHRAQVAATPFTAFTGSMRGMRPVSGHLIVRRVPAAQPAQADQLFPIWRYHAFFTTQPDPDPVAADILHRGHAIIENVHADLKNGPLAHMPSGLFAANNAWLTCAVIAFNLTRAAGCVAGLATATTATVRRTLIAVAARISRSARRITLHLPRNWPWQPQWQNLFDHTHHRKPA
jgi:hypothetical protein